MSLLAVTSGSNGSTGSSVVAPEGVDFDGVNDYLSRSTDLVGNVDSKTFTFSAWVYNGNVSFVSSIYSVGTATAADIYIRSNLGYLELVLGYGEFGSTGVQLRTPDYSIPKDTWSHILISCDTSNTTKRHVIINDIAVSTTWSTYNNQAIKLTSIYNSKYIGIGISSFDNSSKIKGRTSHLFIDYTYRDLSIEANRRLFITADGKPTPTATLKALNPILYLPMKDAATAHINEGTGGNFVQNGTLDTASRGANQDNCKASYFDGSADYLSRTITSPSSKYTVSFSITLSAISGRILDFVNAHSRVGYFNSTTKTISLIGSTASTGVVLDVQLNETLTIGVLYHMQVSLDLSTGDCIWIVNGMEKSVTKTTFINGVLDISSSCFIGRRGNNPSEYIKGSIGELYFDTKYIDLATSNPFWDKDTNRPKPVRQVIRETGITPLIAMPLDASNAGKNYGTGGDFTANSAPYVGARGGSEFWARSAKFDGSTGHLSRGGMSISSKSLSVLLCVNTASTVYLFESSDSKVRIMVQNDRTIYISIQNSSGATIISGVSSASIPLNSWAIIIFSFSLDDENKRRVYINGVLTSMTWYVYINDSVSITSLIISSNDGLSIKTAETLSQIYLTTDYIDFSQEVNRNKFVDQMNFPKDLSVQIEKGLIPKPLIYLPFSDPTNLGKNLGTGGDFTVNGTVTQGADVNG